jgi:membrane-associated protease RseP (regulator of RpoE activity)
MTEEDRLEPPITFERTALRPTARTWIKHIILLLITLCTATVAGVLYPFGSSANFIAGDPQTAGELWTFFQTLPAEYAIMILKTVTDLFVVDGLLFEGLSFSVSLLFILISHEMGHYIACRIYKVDATLPYFIPTPPMIGPAGTFGAFIKIMSPMPSRRAVFDIGVAGPIAGFLALIPVALIGLATMKVASPAQIAFSTGGLTFSDPLLFRCLAYFFGIDLKFGIGNSFYFAAWVGLLVTALNLIPSGQLDGGHAIYAALGEKFHFWTGRIAFVAMATLSVLGMYLYSSPSGFLFAVVLAVMMRVKHPEPADMTPLDGKRKAVAILTLIIFALCFVPFPIQIN